jgi:hypothetical protein
MSQSLTYLAVLPVKVLPDEVKAVDISVMEIEARLQGGEVKVTTWVAVDGEVATC